jgi:hypothetical protein
MPYGLDAEEAFRLALKASELQEVAEWKGLGMQSHESVLSHRRVLPLHRVPPAPSQPAPPPPAQPLHLPVLAPDSPQDMPVLVDLTKDNDKQ